MKLAVLAYLRRDGRTLMLHRIKKPGDMHAGKWNGLGGKLEPGESPERCLAREVREESGLSVREARLKGVLTFPGFAGEDWVTFVFVVRGFTGETIDSPEGVLRWVRDEELLDLPLWPGDRIFLPWLERPGTFSARFVYEDGRLLEHEVAHYPPEG